MTMLRKRAAHSSRAQRLFLFVRAGLLTLLAAASLSWVATPGFAAESAIEKAEREKRQAARVQLSMAMTALPQLAALPPRPQHKPTPPAGLLKRASLPAKTGLPALAEKAALRYGVDPDLVHAVILTESAYVPDAQSHKGAMGLMQLMPATARLLGVDDPWDPRQNIDGGVRYLRKLLRHYDDVELALAAYNAGRKAVERYGNVIPPFKETQTYVARAFSYMDKLRSGVSVEKLRRTGAGAVKPRLSGWGVIFGSFHQKDQARAVIKRNRKIIGKKLGGGRSLVHERQFAGLGAYNAMIVGLKQDGAVAACRSVRQSGGYCLAIPPKQLTDKRAIWR